jgi:hypothetical protein
MTTAPERIVAKVAQSFFKFQLGATIMQADRIVFNGKHVWQVDAEPCACCAVGGSCHHGHRFHAQTGEKFKPYATIRQFIYSSSGDRNRHALEKDISTYNVDDTDIPFLSINDNDDNTDIPENDDNTDIPENDDQTTSL